MMSSVASAVDDVEPEAFGRRGPDADQLVVMHGVEWRVYGALRELIDSPGIRMTYLKGALEIMSPSRRHEHEKTTIARMIEVFALDRDVPLRGYGSTTFKREARERGLEPDECYCVGHELGEAPDIALEIVVTSGGGAGRTRLGFFAGPAISVSPITSIPSPSRQSIPLRRDPARPTWRSSRPNRRAPSELRSARGRKTPSRPGPRRQGRQRRCAESRTPGRTADRVLISSSSMSELPKMLGRFLVAYARRAEIDIYPRPRGDAKAVPFLREQLRGDGGEWPQRQPATVDRTQAHQIGGSVQARETSAVVTEVM
jgi:Putative restriction endonuclease